MISSGRTFNNQPNQEANMKVQTIQEYVEKAHGGRAYAAAKALEVTPATVYSALKGTAFVYQGELYRSRAANKSKKSK